MKYDSIEINGTDYRIEFNWNTVCNFIENENKTLADLDRLNEMTPRQITSFIYEAIKEGCRMENVSFPFTLQDFGAMIRIQEIAEILKIYTKQTSVPVSVIKTKKK